MTAVDELDKIRYQSQPTCPVCFHKEQEAWEINFGIGLEGNAEITCGECETEYSCQRTVQVFFTSSDILPKKESKK